MFILKKKIVEVKEEEVDRKGKDVWKAARDKQEAGKTSATLWQETKQEGES